jgi:hypothetical protein
MTALPGYFRRRSSRQSQWRRRHRSVPKVTDGSFRSCECRGRGRTMWRSEKTHDPRCKDCILFEGNAPKAWPIWPIQCRAAALSSSLASRHQGQATAVREFSVALLAPDRPLFVCFSFTLVGARHFVGARQRPLLVVGGRQPFHLRSCCGCRGCGFYWGDRCRAPSPESAKTGATALGGLSKPLRRREGPVGQILLPVARAIVPPSPRFPLKLHHADRTHRFELPKYPDPSG